MTTSALVSFWHHGWGPTDNSELDLVWQIDLMSKYPGLIAPTFTMSAVDPAVSSWPAKRWLGDNVSPEEAVRRREALVKIPQGSEITLRPANNLMDGRPSIKVVILATNPDGSPKLNKNGKQAKKWYLDPTSHPDEWAAHGAERCTGPYMDVMLEDLRKIDPSRVTVLDNNERPDLLMPKHVRQLPAVLSQCCDDTGKTSEHITDSEIRDWLCEAYAPLYASFQHALISGLAFGCPVKVIPYKGLNQGQLYGHRFDKAVDAATASPTLRALEPHFHVGSAWSCYDVSQPPGGDNLMRGPMMNAHMMALDGIDQAKEIFSGHEVCVSLHDGNEDERDRYGRPHPGPAPLVPKKPADDAPQLVKDAYAEAKAAFNDWAKKAKAAIPGEPMGPAREAAWMTQAVWLTNPRVCYLYRDNSKRKRADHEAFDLAVIEEISRISRNEHLRVAFDENNPVQGPWRHPWSAGMLEADSTRRLFTLPVTHLDGTPAYPVDLDEPQDKRGPYNANVFLAEQPQFGVMVLGYLTDGSDVVLVVANPAKLDDVIVDWGLGATLHLGGQDLSYWLVKPDGTATVIDDFGDMAPPPPADEEEEEEEGGDPPTEDDSPPDDDSDELAALRAENAVLLNENTKMRVALNTVADEMTKIVASATHAVDAVDDALTEEEG